MHQESPAMSYADSFPFARRDCIQIEAVQGALSLCVPQVIGGVLVLTARLG